MIVLDLDGFKEVNDRHGHAVGDDLLRARWSRARSDHPPRHAVCRFGGDEFVVWCTGIADAAEARTAGERMVASVRGIPSIVTQTAGDTFGASAGVVFINRWTPPSVALAAADQALLRAKRLGRDQVMLGDTPAPSGR